MRPPAVTKVKLFDMEFHLVMGSVGLSFLYYAQDPLDGADSLELFEGSPKSLNSGFWKFVDLAQMSK